MSTTTARETATQRIARTTGQEVLFLLALLFTTAFGYWWYQVWSSFFLPSGLLSMQSVIAVVCALVYAVVLPLFWSMLLPNSPAGRLLQRQTWAAPAQLVVIVLAILLSAVAIYVLRSWLVAQPEIVRNGMESPALLAVIVGAIFVPALQFAYMTPEQLLLQIQQGHEIKKLERFQAGEIAMIQARLLWAEQRLAMPYAKLAAGEREESIEVLRGTFKAIVDTQRRIARSIGVSREIEQALGLLDDKEIDERMGQVQAYIEVPARQIEAAMPSGFGRDYVETAAGDGPDAAPAAAPPPRRSTLSSERPLHQDAVPAPSPPWRDGAGKEAPPRTAAHRRAPPRYAAEYEAAGKTLPAMWSAIDLGRTCGKSDRTARDWIAEWESYGLVGRGETKGTFYFTESEN